ncbi:hypothetical protein V8G54_019273 [Vigna mungo]|uniref:Uncharacterized protein n=1 Tax=Vigna mungo TaxID=3915 RepID=A0AAQ3RTK5_VIGMU
MAEVDVPGHAESWGAGYPDLWPSPSCREPLDVSKNFTFDVISGILTDLAIIAVFVVFTLMLLGTGDSEELRRSSPECHTIGFRNQNNNCYTTDTNEVFKRPHSP